MHLNRNTCTALWRGVTYSFGRSLLLISLTSEHRAANEEMTLVTPLEAVVKAVTLAFPTLPCMRGTCAQQNLHTGEHSVLRRAVSKCH